MSWDYDGTWEDSFLVERTPGTIPGMRLGPRNFVVEKALKCDEKSRFWSKNPKKTAAKVRVHNP